VPCAPSRWSSPFNVAYGYTHGPAAAVVPDDSPAPEPADDIRVYEPSTRPGAPLPHSASRRDLRRDDRSATPRAGGSIRRRSASLRTTRSHRSQEAPLGDEVLDRDAISVLIIEPGARGSAIAGSETTAPSLGGRTDSALGARRVPCPAERARQRSQPDPRPSDRSGGRSPGLDRVDEHAGGEVSSSVMPRVIRRGRDR
jgi:hypothetical protein